MQLVHSSFKNYFHFLFHAFDYTLASAEFSFRPILDFAIAFGQMCYHSLLHLKTQSVMCH